MTGNDDTILEYLHEKQVALSPTGLHINLDREGYNISYSTVKRRLGHLEDVNLVERIDRKGGYYILTEKGQRYLSGDLGTEELEKADES
ncbi:winged-helix domain-containing protein [Haladaptatus pallidirubidus]|uniref:Ribonuclease R winged-helix domain-containing protein n=1 Tax=Haladaptatus pallidirubidus TaxID=1008152 RepID=A0AAV3UHS0_9EURY|nr:winged-helix domain-containing protein [Haladaptatus pallidirubidus]